MKKMSFFIQKKKKEDFKKVLNKFNKIRVIIIFFILAQIPIKNLLKAQNSLLFSAAASRFHLIILKNDIFLDKIFLSFKKSFTINKMSKTFL